MYFDVFTNIEDRIHITPNITFANNLLAKVDLDSIVGMLVVVAILGHEIGNYISLDM